MRLRSRKIKYESVTWCISCRYGFLVRIITQACSMFWVLKFQFFVFVEYLSLSMPAVSPHKIVVQLTNQKNHWKLKIK